jgi:CRISPR system Cascade subunit CasB
MHRYVVPRVQGLTERQEDAYYTVAALFALYPGRSWQATGDDPKRETNFGASFGMLARANQESASVERRFVALLNCRWEELPGHLRNAISLLRSKEIPVNWAQLITGINRWNYEDRRVQREWARAFWSLASESESADDAALSGIPVETSGETVNAE